MLTADDVLHIFLFAFALYVLAMIITSSIRYFRKRKMKRKVLHTLKPGDLIQIPMDGKYQINASVMWARDRKNRRVPFVPTGMIVHHEGPKKVAADPKMGYHFDYAYDPHTDAIFDPEVIGRAIDPTLPKGGAALTFKASTPGQPGRMIDVLLHNFPKEDLPESKLYDWMDDRDDLDIWHDEQMQNPEYARAYRKISSENQARLVHPTRDTDA